MLENETLGNNGVISNMNFPDVDHKYLEVEKIDSSLNEVCMINDYNLNLSIIFELF